MIFTQMPFQSLPVSNITDKCPCLYELTGYRMVKGSSRYLYICFFTILRNKLYLNPVFAFFNHALYMLFYPLFEFFRNYILKPLISHLLNRVTKGIKFRLVNSYKIS